MSDFIPNSYSTPNAYCDRFMHLLTPAEWKVLSYTVRRIFGFNKRQDRISLSQYTDGLVNDKGDVLDRGTGLGRSTVMAAIAALIKYKLIIKLGDSNPTKNDGDLYALQMESDLVDVAGLLERVKSAQDNNRSKTNRARLAAETKRRSVALTGFDAEQVVCPTDRGWSVQQTVGGLSNRPGVVCPTDTQKPEENQSENQLENQGIPHPVFQSAISVLKRKYNGSFKSVNPRLVEYDDHPNRLLVLVDSNPPGFFADLEAAVKSSSRKRFQIEVTTVYPVPEPSVKDPDPLPALRQFHDDLVGSACFYSNFDDKALLFCASKYTPDQYTATYRRIKSDKFWASKPVTPETVAKHIAETGATHAATLATPAPVYTDAQRAAAEAINAHNRARRAQAGL
jgi:hypothetical protein